jgi:hypothetical protein
VNVREHFGGKVDRDQARRVMPSPQRTHALVGARVSPATKQFLRMHVYAVAGLIQLISVVNSSIAGERSASNSRAGVTTYMMAIDGTRRRLCRMEDVSSTGAKLTVEGSIEGLKLTEFFLVLSSTGLAYRRCGLAWINGDQLGVSFMRQTSKKNAADL